MSTRLIAFASFLLSYAVLAACAFAQPAGNILLSLVPPGCEVVAGIESPQSIHGHVLFVTHENIIDTDDWLALSGVDVQRAIGKLVWVATSSARGGLEEHLLLVSGRFERSRIFSAARQNGASTMWYSSVESLVVQPFLRERREMHDVRWLAILDNSVVVFGTPQMVQRAIDRYAAHAAADPLLVGRLARLQSDVDSWNALRLPTLARQRQEIFSQLHGAFMPLLEASDDILLAFRYGSHTCIDFDAHTINALQPGSAQQLLSGPAAPSLALGKHEQPHIENLSIDRDAISGSLILTRKQFDSSMQAVRSSSAALPGILETTVR